MATVYAESIDELDDTIRQEVEYGGGVGLGDTGPGVRRAQEWLTLHDHAVPVDGDFGEATERALVEFQRANGRDATGSLDFETWAELTRDLCGVLRRRPTAYVTFRETATLYARLHLRARPRDVGGPDRGPWARLYRLGDQGHGLSWEARFARFVVRQAAESMEHPPPIARSVTADVLMARAAPAEIFVPGAMVAPDRDTAERLLWYVGLVASGAAGRGSVWLDA